MVGLIFHPMATFNHAIQVLAIAAREEIVAAMEAILSSEGAKETTYDHLDRARQLTDALRIVTAVPDVE